VAHIDEKTRTEFMPRRLRHKPRQASSANQAAWRSRAKIRHYFISGFATMARRAGINGLNEREWTFSGLHKL
jgi:hypothetical protein